MKTVQLCLIVLITTFGSACTTINPSVETAKNQHQQSTQQQIQQAFNQLQTTGVIVIKDKHGLHSYGNDLSRAQTPYVPASIVRTPKNQYNTDMSYPIHFRKKILAKLEEGQSIRAVAQHFEINKNTIVEWKKRIEIKRTRPRKPSKVDDDALRADVEQYPDDYQYERAARFGCATSTIGDALKRLNITVKKRPYGTRKQKQNSESSI